MNRYLIAIIGPTAIGKTDLAIQIAREFNTVILSADSRQFYRQMSIGTAKPSARELALAKHYFIDSHDVGEDFSVGDFEKEGLNLLKELFQTKEVVVLAGGSGLYVRALTEGLDTFPESNPEIRDELNKIYRDQGIEPLQQQLLLLDPQYYREVDLNNPQRIIRALEVCLDTGQPFSSFRLNKPVERTFRTLKIGLNTDREKLYQRINLRVDYMITSGLVEEVKQLVPYRHLNALQTVGYSEIFEYLDEKISLEEAISKIKQNTRRFAKRQLTWFRKDPEIQWFEPAQTDAIIAYISEKIAES